MREKNHFINTSDGKQILITYSCVLFPPCVVQSGGEGLVTAGVADDLDVGQDVVEGLVAAGVADDLDVGKHVVEGLVALHEDVCVHDVPDFANRWRET